MREHGKRVRMIDIAVRAGVSRGTVSAVLNGNCNGIRYSKEKAELIRQIARELDYIPNFSARVLNHQPSKTIGMQIDSEESESHFLLLRAVEREAEQAGYRLLTAGAHDNPEQQRLNYRTLRQYGVDAVICHSGAFHDALDDDGKTVLFSTEPCPELPCVVQDIGAGFASAIDHFRREGRRNIAMVTSGHLQFGPVRSRHRAFARLAPEAGRNVGLLESIPLWALTLLGLLESRGLRAPRDISIVGYDNTFVGNCSTPSLSTIDSCFGACGRALVELALERIRNPEAPPRSVVVNTVFIPRESTLTL